MDWHQQWAKYYHRSLNDGLYPCRNIHNYIYLPSSLRQPGYHGVYSDQFRNAGLQPDTSALISNPCYTEHPEGVVLSLLKGSLEERWRTAQTFGTVRNISYKV